MVQATNGHQFMTNEDSNIGWIGLILVVAIVIGGFAVNDWINRTTSTDTIVLNPNQLASATTGSASSQTTGRTLALAGCQSRFSSDGTLSVSCPTDESSSQVAGEQVTGEPEVPTPNHSSATTPPTTSINWWALLTSIFSLFKY